MANRQTKIIGGDGTDTLAFTLDPGLFQYVQSVLVEIDNTAGPDVHPVLSVQTVNGTPVADKTQGAVIPAGDTGRATWALRLTDENGGGGGVTFERDLYFSTTAQFTSLNSSVPGDLPWNNQFGTPLLDLSNPVRPTVLYDGFYILAVTVAINSNLIQKSLYATLRADPGGDGYFMEAEAPNDPTGSAGALPSVALTMPCLLSAGQEIRVTAWQNSGFSRGMGITDGIVTRIS